MDKKKLFNFLVDALIAIVIFGILLVAFFFLSAMIAAVFVPYIDSDILSSFFILLAFISAIVVTAKILKYLKKSDRSQPESEDAHSVHIDYVNIDTAERISSEPSSVSYRPSASYVYKDELFPDAVKIVLDTSVVSAGRLQSMLQIGSIRASNLINEMEEQGIIGPSKGNLPREIFVTADSWSQAVKKFVPPSKPEPPPHITKSKRSMLFCMHCGKEISADVKFCPACGKQIGSRTTASQELRADVPSHSFTRGRSKKRCLRCRGYNVTHETVVESNSAGCLTCLLYVILALTIFGLLIVIPLMLRSKTKTVTYAVCQDCGHRWRVY